MTIAQNIQTILKRSSWIRKMFEEGARMKARYGAENVYDFSLGNPNLNPPENFNQVLRSLIDQPVDGAHGYMPNTGYPAVRKAVAAYLSSEQQVDLTENDIIMTCGAAGALNVIFKAILDYGDEVITPTPCFVEYGAYTANHGGVLKTVGTKDDFTLDIEAIAQAISEKTKAVLINFPNNPTGQIYSGESLAALGELLASKSKALDRTLYLISDEPYRKITYDNHTVASIFPCYAESIVATSYSKDLSIPGERIGFLAVNPQAAYKTDLLNAMALTIRILGFVNAPALMQRAVASLQGSSVDIAFYARKRELLCNGLAERGYEFIKPAGAFYLFPKSPIVDDVKFVGELQEERILAVPGSGFYGPGHFRLAFCVTDETITGSLPAFERVMQKYR
jgi:aspartate aminotransferase